MILSKTVRRSHLHCWSVLIQVTLSHSPGAGERSTDTCSEVWLCLSWLSVVEERAHGEENGGMFMWRSDMESSSGDTVNKGCILTSSLTLWPDVPTPPAEVVWITWSPELCAGTVSHQPHASSPSWKTWTGSWITDLSEYSLIFDQINWGKLKFSCV